MASRRHRWLSWPQLAEAHRHRLASLRNSVSSFLPMDLLPSCFSQLGEGLVLSNDFLSRLLLSFLFPLLQMALSASHNFCGLQFWSLLNETHAGFGNHNVIYNLPLNTFIQLVAHWRKRTPYELTVKGLIWLFPHENPGRGACKRGWEKRGKKARSGHSWLS